MELIAVISKPHKPEIAHIVTGLLQWAAKHGMEVVGDLETAAYLGTLRTVEREKLAALHPRLVIVLGGDGTLLAAARATASIDVSVVSVNLGSLGFLSEVPVSGLYQVLDAWKRGECPVLARSMLAARLVRDGKPLSEYHALNEVVVSKGTFSRLCDFRVELDGQFVSTYKADGVLVSTPTGSTGYSLAAGGPVVAPDVDAFVITPISPHALTNRPLVVRDSSLIVITVEKTLRESAFLTIDGQAGEELQAMDEIHCRRSEHRTQLLRFGERSFFEVLRKKLKWGER